MADTNDTLRENGLAGLSAIPVDSEDLVPVDATEITRLPHARSTPADRFRVSGFLGEGGMGKVDLIRDDWIGREVARKSLRSELVKHERAYKSFVREAKIQGQLEHPAIVPVHDIGFNDDKAPYFTMKRVRGRTLRDVLEADDVPLRRNLDALRRVCLSVDYAHTRGVVHRDIKPENIMVGDFGEIYVLDWGIAKVLGEEVTGERIDVERATTEGMTPVGTPAYMAPEQVACAEIDGRADVYALGAILFEILTDRQLRNTDSVREALRMSMLPSPRPTQATPQRDIPPELDEACGLALAMDPETRLQSARSLADCIERYLDGDLDLELRRKRAAEHLTNANLILETAPDPLPEEIRQDAAREASRCLALDPGNAVAQGLLIELMLDVPATMPNVVRERMLVDRARRTRFFAAFAAGIYAVFAIGVGLWSMVSDIEVREPLIFGFGLGGMGLATLGAILVARSRRPLEMHLLATFLASTIAAVVFARAVSPTVLVPLLILANGFGFVLVAGEQLRRAVLLGSVATPILIVLLDKLAVGTLAIDGGSLSILPRLFSGPGMELLYWAAVFAAPIVIGACLAALIHVLNMADVNLQQVELQRWRLRQLLPQGVGTKLTLSPGSLTRDAVIKHLR